MLVLLALFAPSLPLPPPVLRSMPSPSGVTPPPRGPSGMLLRLKSPEDQAPKMIVSSMVDWSTCLEDVFLLTTTV